MRLFREGKGGEVRASSKVDKKQELLPLCPPGRRWRLSHKWGEMGALLRECRSLGEGQHPSQETGCNTLGFNLDGQRQKGRGGGGDLQPTNLISRFPPSSLDTLIINLPTRELAGVARKDE